MVQTRHSGGIYVVGYFFDKRILFYRRVTYRPSRCSSISPVTSDVYDQGAMYDTASSVIQQKLSHLQGVGQVQVVGSALPAVRVDLDPQHFTQKVAGLPLTAPFILV
jgi:multidrug efflux pump subunit AcrB